MSARAEVQADAPSSDIIVVGAGMAGLCAALAGTEQGARVILLEKGARHGGSTAMCGGALAFAGTDVQRERGIEDSDALLEEDLLEAGCHRNDRELVRVFVQNQHAAYRWLQGLGIPIDAVALSGGQSVPRNHSTDPVAALETLHRCLQRSGRAEIRTRAPVQRLLTRPRDEGSAVVIGVELADGERLLAGGGVVLATGGFSRAADLIERFAPALRDARPMGGEHNTGDGLRMAWALGADMADMGYAKGTFGAPVEVPRAGHAAPLIVSAMYRGALIVNRAGRRFVDESLSYKVIGDRCLAQDGAVAFQVFDRRVMDQSAPLPRNVDFAGALEAGLVRCASTLDGLAAELGIDAEALCRTVRRYNDAVAGHEPDEFGRTSLGAGYGQLAPIDRPPFYGIASTTGLTSTFCGVRTDASARVLRVDGARIEGLYAVGEVTGGFHGQNYMSGTSLAKGCVFGRIAASHAAQRARLAAEAAAS